MDKAYPESSGSVAGWLSLAAAPVFAAMALLPGLPGGDARDVICASAHGSPLGGMAVMYALMSAFHLAPWLKLLQTHDRRRT